jgi:uncharacterized membrane protein
MHKGRLEAFSDGAIAIFLTIMVLELHAPAGLDWNDLRPLTPQVLTYVLSFVYVGIYWTNHHHMLQAVESISGGALWANLHLLFWLSLTPFVTGWLGEHPGATVPVAAYGLVLLMNAIAYTILNRVLIRHEGPDSRLARAVGADTKGWASLAIYVVAIGLAFVIPVASMVLYAVVAAIWFIPDRRIERVFESG